MYNDTTQTYFLMTKQVEDQYNQSPHDAMENALELGAVHHS